MEGRIGRLCAYTEAVSLDLRRCMTDVYCLILSQSTLLLRSGGVSRPFCAATELQGVGCKGA